MGWKVRITAIAPQSRQQISHLAQLLARLPGVTEQQASAGLRKPPFDLPVVKTEQDAAKLKLALDKVGLICETLSVTEPLHPDPKARPQGTQGSQGDAQHPKVSSPARPAVPLELADTGHRTQLGKGIPIDLKGDDLDARPIELRATMRGERISLAARTGARLHRLATPFRQRPRFWIPVGIVGIVLVVIASGLGVKTLMEPTSAQESDHTDSVERSIPKTPGERKRQEDRKKFEQAKQQLAYSDKLLMDAQKTPDAKKAASLMEKALKYNPLNSEAWQQLAAKYERIGDQENAQKAFAGYPYSEKTRKTLEGIAQYFGGKKAVARVSVSSVEIETQDSVITDSSFHKRAAALYDTVHAVHPEKEFTTQNIGKDTLSVKVLPGDSFPAFDSWEDLERKAKKR